MYIDAMSSLQVRDVPEELRTTLKLRAAASGKSLSDYVRGELLRLAEQPTLDEWLNRTRLRGSSGPVTPAAEILRAERSR